jgi:hypothetical protein
MNNSKGVLKAIKGQNIHLGGFDIGKWDEHQHG